MKPAALALLFTLGVATTTPGVVSPRTPGVVFAIPVPGAAALQTTDAAKLIHDGFDAAYSLDYDQALAFMRRALTLDPASSATHRAVADILWLQMLFLRGSVTIDDYLGGVNKSQLTLPKPPPALADEFARELDQAIALATARVKKDKNDAAAEFDLGAAYGLRASYTASIEGRVSGAFGPAKDAFGAHERVLELAPDWVEANLIVGTYRYIVSTLSLPMRWMAYIVGFGGGKEKGIGMIEAAASRGQQQVDATVALTLIYTREHRYADALRLIHDLERRYPNNRLFVLEEGATDLRLGQPQNADVVLTAGLVRLSRDPRTRIPGELGLWLYKRGAARVALGRRADATADLNDATAAQPIGWVLGRIHVELGKVADLDAARPRAMAEYREAARVCRLNNDPMCVDEAERLQRHPFKLE